MASTYTALPLRRSIYTSLSLSLQPQKTRGLQQHLPVRLLHFQSRTPNKQARTTSRRHNSTSTATYIPEGSAAAAATTIPPPSPPSPAVAQLHNHPQTDLPPHLLSTLPLLSLQSAHPDGVGLYATLHIHARPYLLTLGDRLRLPFRMPNVQPGDVLRLTHASTLGTRDYTLRGSPWVDARLFEARAVVAGVESEPMRSMEKTKQRNRKVKTVKSKHRYTEVLVTQLRVRTMRELAEEGVLGQEGDAKALDG